MKRLENKLGENFTCFQRYMERRMSFIESKLDAKIENLEKKVEKVKGVEKIVEKEVVQSTKHVAEDFVESKESIKHNTDDGAESILPFWLIMTKPSSQDDTPVDFVVHKKRNAQENWNDMEDVTLVVAKEECEIRKPNFEDTLYVSYHRERVEAVSKRLDEKKAIGKMRLFMATTQKSPFQRDSTMKRVMQEVVSSPTLYDPFGPYNEVKAQELLDCIAEEE
ncbi:unnamed protein product [Cochlearia groenlandica]